MAHHRSFILFFTKKINLHTHFTAWTKFLKKTEVNKNESNVWIQYFVYIVLNIVFFPLSWISCFRVNTSQTIGLFYVLLTFCSKTVPKEFICNRLSPVSTYSQNSIATLCVEKTILSPVYGLLYIATSREWPAIFRKLLSQWFPVT